VSALGDTLRRLADLADAGIIHGEASLDLHVGNEQAVRDIASTLGGAVSEYRSHCDTFQYSNHGTRVDSVRVTAMVATDRPWVEAPETEEASR
jgi:hypothetical protein